MKTLIKSALVSKSISKKFTIAVFIAFFASGASGLILEIVWLRMLKNVFGCTVFATSTVLSGFMAGLALGSFSFGRLADRLKNMVRMYALLEFGVGVTALLLPVLFTFIIPSRVSLYRWQLNNGYTNIAVLAVFAMSFVILLIPTTLMGGTLPVLSKHFIQNRHTVGKRIGLLYGINTLGAMLGAFWAGFILLKLLGQTNTMRFAAILNISIGILFFLLSRYVQTVPSSTQDIIEEKIPEKKVEDIANRLRTWVMIAFGLSGLASLGYEVVWTRALMYFINHDTYVFSAMLTVFLLGTALGSFLYNKYLDSDTGLVKRFSLIEISIGLVATFSLILFSILKHFNAFLSEFLIFKSGWGGTGYIVLKFLNVMIVLFIPTLLIGATFPLVSKIVTSLGHKGKSIGNIYSMNTIGCITGSFLTGFTLIPLLGVQSTIVFLGGINIVVGLSLMLVSQKKWMRKNWPFAGVPLLLWLCIGFFTVKTPMIKWSQYFDNRFKLLYYNDSISASVAVLEGEDGHLEINLNGESTAYTNYSDIQVHQYLGHLPMLIYGSPKQPDVLVIGFGLGSTCWSILQHDVKSLDCVELVDEERYSAAYFEKENHNVISHPKFRFITGDGRNHLLATEKIYDVISINAIHPRLSPGLYTSDFYQLARNALADDGVFCAWITQQYFSNRGFKILLRSFLDIFPEGTLWDVNSQHFVLIGTKKPLSVDFKLWTERLKNKAVNDHLKEVHLEQPYEILSHFLLDAAAMKSYIGEVPLNSDNRPYIEFITEKFGQRGMILEEILKRRINVLSLFTNLPEDYNERQKVYDDLVRYFESMRFSITGRYFLSVLKNREKAEPLLDIALQMCPESESLSHLKGKCSHILTSDRFKPYQKYWALGWKKQQEGKWNDAADAYRNAIQDLPNFSKAYFDLAVVEDHFQHYRKALDVMKKALRIIEKENYKRLHFALQIQLQLQESGGDYLHVKMNNKILKLKRNDVNTFILLARNYRQAGLAAKAEQVLEKAMQHYPESAELYLELSRNLFAKGNLRQADQYLKKAIQLNPDLKFSHSQLQ